MEDRIRQIRKIVKEKHHELDFKYHIIPVVKNALLLAKKLNADREVVEVAAYLHDIGRAKNWKDIELLGNKNFTGDEILKKIISDKHHLLGAEEAKKILLDLGYDNSFIKKVEHCILTHRGRVDPNPETEEAKIVSSADAMSHFDCLGF